MMKLFEICDEIRKGISLNYTKESLYERENHNLFNSLSFKGNNEHLNDGLIYDISNYAYDYSKRATLPKDTEIKGKYFLFFYRGHDDIYEIFSFEDIKSLKAELINNINSALQGWTIYIVPIIDKTARKYIVSYKDRISDEKKILEQNHKADFKDMSEISIELF